MITRRSIMAMLGLAPAIAAAPKVETIGYNPDGTAVSRAKLFPIWHEQETVDSAIREFNPHGGDLGRGIAVPIERMLAARPYLKSLGFEPYYVIPGIHTATNRFIPVYSISGSLCGTVWHAFAREFHGRHEIVAFEHDYLEMKRFHERTGLTLHTATQS